MKKKSKETYESPVTEIFDVQTRSMVCVGSGTRQNYEETEWKENE